MNLELTVAEIIKTLDAGENVIIVGEAGVGKTTHLDAVREQLSTVERKLFNAHSNDVQWCTIANSSEEYDAIILFDKEFDNRTAILMDEVNKSWIKDYISWGYLNRLNRNPSDVRYVSTLQVGGSKDSLKEAAKELNLGQYFSKIVFLKRINEALIINRNDSDRSFDWTNYESSYTSTY